MYVSKKLFDDLMEEVCDLDNENPGNPRIKRIYDKLYQLGKRQGFIA